MKKEWVLLDANSEKVSRISKTLGISETVAQVLVNRGIDDVESASLFLQAKLRSLPDPSLLKNAQKASELIVEAVKARKRIVIYGDYDVDGITSTVLMYQFLKILGADVHYYIPHRLEDGYGLNTYTLEEIATEGGQVVITVDCGITSIEEVRYARQLGLDIIIADHHHIGETIPDAIAVINPHFEDCCYPFKEMAAVGVAFSLLMVLKKTVEKDGFFRGQLPNLKEYMDIVALGTVADMVPLVGTNRIFVKHGLQQMRENKRPGLVALAHVCGLKSLDEVTPAIISYKMAPRLNAAGRIGNAVKGVDLLLSPTYEQATKIAEELNVTNEYRQKLEAEIFDQAVKMVEERGLHRQHTIVLHSQDWHPGVIGIVASRLVERYYKPTIMISVESGIGRGSARSIQSLHIYNVLEHLNELLVQYGGHKYAAGLTIREENIETFVRRFEEVVAERLTPEDYRNILEVDAVLDLSRLTPELVVALLQLEPFGMNNSEPNFLARNLIIKKQSVINRSHLHWRLSADGSPFQFNAIGFGLAGDRPLPAVGDRVDIVYFPRVNTFNGDVSLQLYVKDFRPASGQ